MSGRAAFLSAGWGAVVLGWRASAGCTIVRVLLSVTGALAVPAVALFGKLLVDELARGRAGQPAAIAWYAAGGALAGVAGVLVGQVQAYVRVRHNAAIALLAESALFRKVCSFGGLKYFEDPDFQDRLLVAESAATSGPDGVTDFVEGAVKSVVSVVSFLGMVIVIWPALAVVLVLAAVPGLVAQLVLASRQVDATMAMSPWQRRRFFYRMLLTDDRAAKEVRLYGLGDFFRGRQLDALRRTQDLQVAIARRTATVQSGLSLLGALIAGAATAVVALRVVRGEASPGDVLLFMTAVTGVQSTLADLVGRIGTVTETVKMFQRYQYIMELPADLVPGEMVAPDLRSGIRFEDVWFRYGPDSAWVLRGVTFEIPAGGSVAIVGVNGAGKSTLVKLLCRFYEPERGRITWDGVDVRELSAESLRLRMAATFQDFMTYDLAARENIGVGDLTRLDDLGAVHAAAERADIHDAITAFPAGYDTMLSRVFLDAAEEPGVMLSGGQWQRVALARSLLRERADVLVLDEPSSGLDAEAEHRVHRTLQEFRRGKTSVLISHRLGTLREADRIVVLDDGVITEQGDHDQLMALSRVYARLFTIQGQGYQERV